MPTALFLRRGYIKNGKQQEALSADVPGATVGFRRQIPLAAQPKRDEHGRKERLGPLPQNHPSQHRPNRPERSEEHTSELQSRLHLVCRLLLEKKKTTKDNDPPQNEG